MHIDEVYLNSAIHILCKIIKSIVGSVAESGIAAAYVNVQEVILIRYILKKTKLSLTCYINASR